MRVEHFDPSHGGTITAVVIGALLATLSGIVATQLEAYFKRRERERDAALLFGELLSTLRVLLGAATASQKVGDPFGPVTTRILHACRGELDIYDRNRERLYDLRDAALRGKIHSLAVRMAMPLDGLLSAAPQLAERLDDPALAGLRDARAQGWIFLRRHGDEIPDIVKALGILGKHTFAAYADTATPAPGTAP